MRNHGMAEVRQSECREHSLVNADVRTGAPHTPAFIASEGRAAQFGVQRRLGVRLEKLRFGVIPKKVGPILITDELMCT
jgi:hypothetical protein